MVLNYIKNIFRFKKSPYVCTMTRKTLNLVDMDCGDIPYEIQKFPDGQQNVKVSLRSMAKKEDSVVIESRLNNFMDLELIICATQSLRAMGFEEITLFVPYFLGARSDRNFGSGTNNYLKDVICPIINMQGYEEVVVVDPHSNCLEMGIKKFRKFYSLVPLSSAVRECKEGFFIISPDAGASQRVSDLSQLVNIPVEVITCTKVRENGKIVKTNVPAEDLQGRDCIIIDDICSKGGTFIGIAKELKKKGAGNIYLVVSHYEGTAREQDLKDAGITKVFTTNSISDVVSDFVQKHKIIQTL